MLSSVTIGISDERQEAFSSIIPCNTRDSLITISGKELKEGIDKSSIIIKLV
jgi:hypothetical protein